MFDTDAYPELIFASAQQRVHRLERARLEQEERRDRFRRRRARLLARCRRPVGGR